MQLSRLCALGDSAYPEPDSSLLSPGASSAAAFRYRHRVVPHLHRKLLGMEMCHTVSPPAWAGATALGAGMGGSF